MTKNGQGFGDFWWFKIVKYQEPINSYFHRYYQYYDFLSGTVSYPQPASQQKFFVNDIVKKDR